MRLILVSIAAAVALAGCSMGSEAADTSEGGATASSSISAVDNEFEPTDLQLTPGEEVTVEFTNDGETAHTFTSEELDFDSGIVEPGDTAEVTFTAPEDDTTFVCTIHEASDDMVGTIVAE